MRRLGHVDEAWGQLDKMEQLRKTKPTDVPRKWHWEIEQERQQLVRIEKESGQPNRGDECVSRKRAAA